MTSINLKLSFQDIINLLLINLIWASAYLVMNEGLKHVTSVALTALRFTAVAVLMLPLLKKPKLQWWQIMLPAFFASVGHIFLLNKAMEAELNVSAVIVISQLGVPFTSVVGLFILRQPMLKRHYLSFLLAMLGTMIIFGAPEIEGYYLAALAVVGSALAIAYVNTIITLHHQVSPMQFLGWQAVYAAPMLWLLVGSIEGLPSIESLKEPGLWGAIFYLSVIGVMLAESSFYRIMRRYSVHQVIAFIILTPVFGVLLSCLIYQEPIGWEFLSGFAIMLLALIIVR